jgi:two-component sensor histidine kinase
VTSTSAAPTRSADRAIGARDRRPRPAAPLPPIARRLRRTEWLAIVAGWLVLELQSVSTLADRAQRAGIRVAVRDFLAVQLLDWAAWVLLLWPLFAALDATPLAPGRRLRNLALRAAAVVAIAALHTALVYPALAAIAGPLHLSPELWIASVATPSGMFFDDLSNVAVALAIYALFRRAYRRRLELARAAELERSLLRAQLHALDLELQPHFLFNTLNAITALVRSEPERAEQMLVTLGDLLRATLGRAAGQVTVADELDHLELYLDLQRTRFGDRLDARVEVDADVLGALVPGMVLQPLVENALTHGLAPKCAPGTVRVSAARDGPSLVLRVSDDGVGLPAGGARDGTGVRNTRERLATLYGAEHAFSLTPAPAGGTVAEIRLPLQLASGAESEGAAHAMLPARPAGPEMAGVT